jgi:CBS domain-containing protein
MNLTHLIKTDLVFINGKIDSKEQAIRLLIEKSIVAYPFLDKEIIFNKIIEHENVTKNLYKHGVLISCARIENLNDFQIAVLVPKSPIIDKEKEIRILFLILTDISKSNLYLNVITSILNISKNEENIQILTGANTKEEFIKKLTAFNIMVKKVIIVKDIMATPPIFLFPDSTIKDALDFMSKNHISYLPICDKNQKLVGEVSIYDILAIGIPHYTQMLDNLRFLQSLEPLEDLLKKESIIKLESIMRIPSSVLKPDSVIIEAIFQFIKNPHHRSFPVVENDICVGVLSHMDIINKFLGV